MSKDAYYFSHDSNSRNDMKMVKLRRLAGVEGIGLFWCVIEMLREADNYELPITNIEDICYELRSKESTFNYLFDTNLLYQNDGVFYSNSLKNRMQKLDEIKQKRKEAGAKGGKAKPTPTKPQPIAKQKLTNSKPSKVKQSKEDKSIVDNSKEDENKEDDIIPEAKNASDYQIFVDKWLKFYSYKTGNTLLFDATAGKCMKSIIVKLDKMIKNANSTDSSIELFHLILTKWDILSSWQQENCLDLKIFNAKFNLIINRLKNESGNSETWINVLNKYQQGTNL